MAENIKIERGQKLIKVMAAQVRNERLDSNVVEEANNIISELAQDPDVCHQLQKMVRLHVEEQRENKPVRHIFFSEAEPPAFSVLRDGCFERLIGHISFSF